MSAESEIKLIIIKKKKKKKKFTNLWINLLERFLRFSRVLIQIKVLVLFLSSFNLISVLVYSFAPVQSSFRPKSVQFNSSYTPAFTPDLVQF